MKIYDEEETVMSRRAAVMRGEETLHDATRESVLAIADPIVMVEENPPELTIFLPVYNEEPNLRPLHAKLDESLLTLGRTSEIIYVDDGSTDGSLAVLRDIAAHDPRVRVISFRRNFGKMAAMVAGIEHARGRTLVALDADLQNDPVDIERLLEKLEEGYDVVSGWRLHRQDKKWTRKVPSMLANKLISWASGVSLHDYGCCLKAYRREALEGVRFYGEMHRFIPIYAAQSGARVAEIPVQHHPRTMGVSKFGKLSRTFEVLLDLFTIKFNEAYRTKPMHLFGSFGFIAFGISIFALLLSLVLKLAAGTGIFATPLPTIFVVMLALGVQFILMGLLADMTMRTYYESQRKPTYTVREMIGFGDTRQTT